jgi:hypothetical protein
MLPDMEGFEVALRTWVFARRHPRGPAAYEVSV